MGRVRVGPDGGIVAILAVLFLGTVVLTAPVHAASSPPTIAVSPAAGPVGSEITVTGSGFPPSTSLALRWTTANASWVVTGNPPQVTGTKLAPWQRTLGSVETDASGAFQAQVVAMSDFGNQHILQAFGGNGTAYPAKAIFILEPSFRITPSSGPAGTPITVTAAGLGYGLYSTSYHLSWDNSYVGYMTALASRGATNFTIYASGNPGAHYVDIYQGYPGPGYLNPQQGPPASETQSWFPPEIPFHAQFTVTPQQVTARAETTSSGMLVGGTAGVVGMVLLTILLGCGFFVSRKTREDRKAISKVLLAGIIIALVAVAGVGLYIAAGPGPSSTTNESSTAQNGSSGPHVSFVPLSTVDRPPIAVPVNTASSGPRISVTPTIASVGDNVTVDGQGFVPNSKLPLVWTTRQGSNVAGYRLVDKPLRSVTAGSDGSFSFTMRIPSDLGGLHFIAAGNLTEKSNGTVFIQRSAVLSSTQGPEGATISVIMRGVGWDFNTNIVAFDYDNSYIGYACGFNSGGNVTVNIVATGSPGLHTIDLYPSEWWGPSTFTSQQVVEYRYPLLTPQDHPELMPSFHFTILTTAS